MSISLSVRVTSDESATDTVCVTGANDETSSLRHTPDTADVADNDDDDG